MENRNRLQRIVEGLGYDKGLEQVMIKVINTLPESTASNTLRTFVAYQESMPEILNKVAAFIAEAELQPPKILKASVPRNTRKTGRQPESANSTRESVQKAISTKETAKSVQVDNPAVVSTALLDLTVAYANIVAMTIETWSALFRVWLPSDIDSDNLPKPKANTDTAFDAIRSAIAARATEFDKMNEEIRRMAEEVVQAKTVSTSVYSSKQIATAGQRTKEKTSSSK